MRCGAGPFPCVRSADGTCSPARTPRKKAASQGPADSVGADPRLSDTRDAGVYLRQASRLLGGCPPRQPLPQGRPRPGSVRRGENQEHLSAGRYKRPTARRGPLRALVAVEHSIITAIRHMLTGHVPYQELGGTYFTQRAPETRHPPSDHRTQPTRLHRHPQPDRRRGLTTHDQAPGGRDDPGHPALPRPTLTWTYLRVTRGFFVVQAGGRGRIIQRRHFSPAPGPRTRSETWASVVVQPRSGRAALFRPRRRHSHGSGTPAAAWSEASAAPFAPGRHRARRDPGQRAATAAMRRCSASSPADTLGSRHMKNAPASHHTPTITHSEGQMRAAGMPGR